MIAQLDVSAVTPTDWTREDVEDAAHLLAHAAEVLGLVGVTVTTHTNFELAPASSEGSWDGGE
jgi:hypothetical protein